MNKKFLPIGTVVILKNATKKIMITGFLTITNDKIYDYSGCLYPEGIISNKQAFVFNHEQIERIYHLGLIDEEEKVFKNKLNELEITNQLQYNTKDNI